MLGSVGAPALDVAAAAVVFAVPVDRVVAVVLTLVTEGAGLGDEVVSLLGAGRVALVSN